MHSKKVKSVRKKKANTSFILVRQRPVSTSSPQATSWDFPFLVKFLYKQRATKDVTSLVLFEQPSRCILYLKRTTKDVSSLVFTIYNQEATCFLHRIFRRLVLWILCFGNQKNSETVSSLNSFGKREKEWRRR